MIKILLKTFFILLGFLISYVIAFFCIRIFYIMGPSTAEKINLSNRKNEILLIIDVQSKYMKNIPLNLENKYISNINKVIDHTYKINKKVVNFISVRKNNFFSSLFLFDVAIQRSNDANIDSRLNIKNPIIFEKFKADGFYNKNFKSFLKDNNIKKVFITGIAAEVCVSETIKGALNNGYEIVVIKETIIPIFGNKSLSKKLEEFKNLGVKIITVNDYLNIEK